MLKSGTDERNEWIDMEEILSKLSNYGLLNNLFPGVVFNFILCKIIKIDILENISVIEKIIMCYSIGMVISRIGSLIVKPILEKLGIVRFSNYNDYINASEKDKDIKSLSEVNDMYRNMLSLFLILTFVSLLKLILVNEVIVFLKYTMIHISTYLYQYSSLGLVILFLLAYRKQTNFITKRIERVLRKNEGGE